MTLHKKCVVVLSGGPDSVTVAYWAKDQGYDVSGLTFKYGQIATKEIHYDHTEKTFLLHPAKEAFLTDFGTRSLVLGLW